MNYCVEVATKPGFRDTRAEDLEGQIELLGIPGVDSVDIADRYYLGGALNQSDVEQLAASLLCDPIIEQAQTSALGLSALD